MIDERIAQFMREKLSSDEADSAIQFTGSFSRKGQIVVATVFVTAHERGVAPEQVRATLNSEWERNWQYQHPDIKGDPDAPGGAGEQNRSSLMNVYTALGLPLPTRG